MGTHSPQPKDDVVLPKWIGGRHARHRQPQLAADDVTALRDRARFVERDLAVAALASEAAVARHDQPLRRDVLQRLPDLAGDVLRPIRLQRSVTDRADADLLLQIVLQWLEQLEVALVAIL